MQQHAMRIPSSVWMLGPLPPVPGAVAEYVDHMAEILHTRAGLDVHVVTHAPTRSRHRSYSVHSCQEFICRFAQHRDDTVFVYHLANDRTFDFVYAFLLTYPGLVIFHDTVVGPSRLHHLLEWAVRTGNVETLRDVFPDPVAPVWKELLREQYVRISELGRVLRLTRPFLQMAWAAIVHSPEDAVALRDCLPDAGIHVIPPGIGPSFMPPGLSSAERAALRRRFGIPEGHTLLGIFATRITPPEMDPVLQSLRDLHQRGRSVTALVVTRTPADEPLYRQILQYGLHARVRVVAPAGSSEYRACMAFADIAYVCTRWSPGDALLDVLTLMSAARPVIVQYRRPFAHWPNGICARVSLREGIAGMVRQIEVWTQSPTVREAVGCRAQQYVRHRHSPDRMVQNFQTVFRLVPVYRRLWRDPRKHWTGFGQPLLARLWRDWQRRVPASIARRLVDRVHPLLPEFNV